MRFVSSVLAAFALFATACGAPVAGNGSTETPHLDALAASGVQAESLIPVFPSKTFPSHYSMVTGLHPGNHGVVSNNMRDPRWEGEFHLGTEELLKGRWWGGEPIWTTANKQGLITASFFWPGSDVLINGDRPTYFYPYDGSVPYEDRVDQVLAWLDMPAGERPSFITLYFADPNDTAHGVGPEAPEALAAARRVDEIPARYRLRGSRRVAPILGIPDVGWSVTTRAAQQEPWGYQLLGDHGGDPRHPDMGGIFIASGPTFARGDRVPAFENVEIYNLIAYALGIVPAPNDGDLSRVEGTLR